MRKSILTFCSETLLDAERGVEMLIDFYENHPLPLKFAVEIAQARIDVMYPYWMGILVEDERNMDDIDEWLYDGGVRIPSREVCVGVPRRVEFEQLGTTIARWEFSEGKAREITLE